MSGMGQQPAPGWYDDPEQPGHQRWWDGARWTEHRQPRAAAAQFARPAASGTLSQADERNWAMAAHLSALLAAFVALAFLGPLTVYLIKRDDSEYVRRHAAEALNFNLSMLLYGVVGVIVTLMLTIVLVGVLLIPVLVFGALAWLVLCIVGGAKASNGELYRYPLTIRFVS